MRRPAVEGLSEADAHAAYLAAGWPVERDERGRVVLRLGLGWCALVTADQAGADARDELARTHGPLPRSLSVRGHDALRVDLYRCGADPMLTSADMGGHVPGLSVWGAGQELALPPSEARMGRLTRWAPGIADTLDPRDVARLPAWLERMARDPAQAERSARQAQETVGERPLSDVGNAERLARRHGQDLRWCEAWGSWLAWDGTHWKADETGEVIRRAVDTIRALGEEAAREAHEGRRRELLKWALASESRGRVEAMVSLCKAQPGIAVTVAQLDTDPWKLNVANGTIDLRTGVLLSHRREDLITKVSLVAWDPTAPAPTFAAFLSRSVPSAPVRACLARLVGYAATGVIREHVLPIHYGGGGNGKSVLTDIVMHALGTYASKIPTDVILAKTQDAHPAERATLRGLRFAACSETARGRALDEATVKDLTGGENISARLMYGNWFHFAPTHTLWLSTNNKPRIRETSNGIWRRVLLIPWTVQIPDAEQDAALPEKLRAEASGILRWIVDGCLEWQRCGISPPDEVRVAVEEYRAESDWLGDFLESRCTSAVNPDRPSDAVKILAGALYRAYVTWCESAAVTPASQTAFGRAMGDKHPKKAIGGYPWYLGIRLLEPRELRERDERDAPVTEAAWDA
jgi:putative DNA primase/helicase